MGIRLTSYPAICHAIGNSSQPLEWIMSSNLTAATGSNIGTTTEREQSRRTLQEILPPYSVILHNDDHHAMDYVVEALVKSVPSLSVNDAVNIMLEAHNQGRAVVITCPLEQAELYRDRLQSYRLGVSIERA